MAGATRQLEITVRSIAHPSTLARLMAITVSCGADVLAACSYWDNAAAVVNLVTEDPARTMHALEEAGFTCHPRPVVLVEMPDQPGLPTLIANKLIHAGIHVREFYSLHAERDRTYAVFKTSDDDRAVHLLEVDALIHDLAVARSARQPSKEDVDELMVPFAHAHAA